MVLSLIFLQENTTEIIGKSETQIYIWPFFAVCICVCVPLSVCVCVCVCQWSIDELSTMLNGTVLAAETAGPNLRVRDKRPSQL